MGASQSGQSNLGGPDLRRALIFCIGLAILSIAGGAQASSNATSTFTVFLGEQSEIPGGFKKYPVTLNQFMPSSLTVAAGDKVTFSSATFHTVTYTPRPIPLLVPDPAKGTYQNIVDSAGQPFYFDGRPKFIYNPAALGPFGPKAVSGKTPTSSGVLSPQGPKAPAATATFAFPTPGSYKLVCTVHPGMEARIVVKPAGAAVPKTPAQVQAQALLQQTAGYTKGKALLASTKVAPNTVAMGVGGKVSLLAFLPKVLRVKVGTTVSIPNKSPSEVHNLTFGPPKYIEKLQKQTDLLPDGAEVAQPGDTVPAVRIRPEAVHVRRGDDARQRLLRHRADGRIPDRVAASVARDLHDAGDVQVLLLDPRARHGRDGGRHPVIRRRPLPE